MFSLLYVDDEPDLPDLARLFLEGTGAFTVTLARSGEEGLGLIARQDFDAIVSDYQMPEMDGIDFLKNVRKSHGNIPFILFTGRGREDVVIEAINNGVDFYLRKGSDPQAQFAELAQGIRQAVDRRSPEELRDADGQSRESEKRQKEPVESLKTGGHQFSQSDENYRLIAENSPDMIYVVDTRGYLLYINTLAADAMQARPESLVGRHLSEIFRPPAAAERPLKAIRRVIDTRTPFRRETFEEFPSGGMWIDVRLTPILDASGTVIGVLGLSHDISDRKHAEEALRESEMKYRVLVENSHDVIYAISPEGILTFVSPGWTAHLGHDTAYVTGKPFRHFVYPADVPACEAFLKNVVATGQRQSGIEYRVFHADGSVRLHTSTISPIIDDRGKVVSYVGSSRDITEMKQFQNAIRESNRKLNLLSSITRHDVANQLTVVQGYTQLAALRKPEPVIADFLSKISSAVDTIQHQIEFTRAYQDMGVQAPAWHRVCDVIRSVRPPQIRLECTCGSCEIFSDPMIAKVFFNLFDNAVRYGERVTTVTVACEMAGDELIITFADDGVGIPLNEKQRIFEKGYGRHTGFGLFLVREILAITGISIHETGSHGKGARFEISVPNGAYRQRE
ncbi:PAS domain S-box protein [uncultured Methanoregula sp.]|uniref:PAS domain S-box protein n=1 Tax=uncultured Methanoregula sp. TaxID=1005933 RepID=UPI002AAB37E1|nr:PAS domain S-box protein [uncultured Methanoregula sp.]